MSQVVVITGGGAGVGRATAREFAKNGYGVGLIGRDSGRLAEAVDELKRLGAPAATFQIADVADADAIERAAEGIVQELGPIGVWINNAMATVFSAVKDITPEEFRRATEVTYLGTVHGTMAALRRMRMRNRGVIVNVGSALAYRSVPLQAAYCGAKSAIRGFTDSLRTEILHDGLDIHLTMVHLPAVNTPQFGWAKNRTGRGARPVAPVYQPEVPARAIYHAAHVRQREIWLGFPTIKAILANRLAPHLADVFLAKTGYSGQTTAASKSPDAPSNLYDPVPGNEAAHGDFGDEARSFSWMMVASEHRYLLTGAAALLFGLYKLSPNRKPTSTSLPSRRPAAAASLPGRTYKSR
jgi:short-subunit dehydrogenase